MTDEPDSSELGTRGDKVGERLAIEEKKLDRRSEGVAKLHISVSNAPSIRSSIGFCRFD